jgi:hypothetical protein
LILGRRVAAGCHGAPAGYYEFVLTYARYDVLVTDAELVAEAATALTVVVAGAVIRFARAGAALAVAATAHLVLRTHLPSALTARRVGSSLTDAQRCQRAPYEGCTYQFERPTS